MHWLVAAVRPKLSEMESSDLCSKPDLRSVGDTALNHKHKHYQYICPAFLYFIKTQPSLVHKELKEIM